VIKIKYTTNTETRNKIANKLDEYKEASFRGGDTGRFEKNGLRLRLADEILELLGIERID